MARGLLLVALLRVWPVASQAQLRPGGLTLVQRKHSRRLFGVQADSFAPVDGGLDRVCRGSSITDDDGSYYIVRAGEAAASLYGCKAACLETAACQGIEFRVGRCEVWVRPGGIQAAAQTQGVQCLRYLPFLDAEGDDQACRGSSAADNNPAYYRILSASSLSACQDLCLQSPACRGIEFGAPRCELWTRDGGISFSVAAAGLVCQPLAPFVVLDGPDRGCRGSDESDLASSFYVRHTVASLDACKVLCARNSAICKGVEYSSSGTCDLWTRASGIQATAVVSGSVCLRLGALEAADAFQAVDGGAGRACRGSHAGDWSTSYFTWVNSPSLEACKSECAKTSSCVGIEFLNGCKVWTKTEGVESSISFPGATCLRYEPFTPVDGGEDRGCYGPSPHDIAFSAGSLETCKQRCMQKGSRCVGLEHNLTHCWVWGSELVGAYTKTGRRCLRHQPFVAVDVDGFDRACSGMSPEDVWPTYYTQVASSSLESCKAACSAKVACRGIQYDAETCQLWTRSIHTSSAKSGSVCLRLGPYDPWESASAFEPIISHACASEEYQLFQGEDLESCQRRCMSVPGCRGVDVAVRGCRLWQGTNFSWYPEVGTSCYRYQPFRDVDGGLGRDCRGTSGDLQSAYFVQTQAASVQACEDRCVQHSEADVLGTPCKGIAFDSSSGSCRLWVRAQGVEATAGKASAVCRRYEPFLASDGGRDRMCVGPELDLGSAYVVLDLSEAPSLEKCRALCVARGCRGVEYGAHCKLWMMDVKPQYEFGSICLQSAAQSAQYAALDAFVAVHGGEQRACRGSHALDVAAGYFTAVGPHKAGTLEKCKSLCLSTAGCSAVQFSLAECQLWTRSVEATAAEAGSACFRLQPFRGMDGGQDRFCESDTPPDVHAVGSLVQCQELCSTSERCTGINFQANICHVFTADFSSRPQVGSSCSSYQHFVAVDGGVNRDCRGISDVDVNDTYFLQFPAVTSLQRCQLRCFAESRCQGIAFDQTKEVCKVWITQIGTSVAWWGTTCLRYGIADPLYETSISAFQPMNGGENRACRGKDVQDNLDSHYFVSTAWPENHTVDACQTLCMKTAGCKGIEFWAGGCEVWTLPDGIQASVHAPGRTCLRYEPYQTLDGFLDRVCRGSNIYDSQASYYAIYSPSVAPTLDACKDLCRRTHSCKGIEYRGWCEVWTRPGGIDAVAPSLGAQCWQYRPFVHVEGGVNRACRGEDELDNWPSYYSVHGLTGIEACKSLCVRTDGCKGIDYRPGRCEVWTRRGGIQKTAYFEGSLCMRLGPNDVWDDNNAFVALNGGSGTCQGTGMSALTRGSLSLHSCKVRCMSTPACRGIGYSSAVCTLWLGSGELSVIPDPDSSCHSYQPFRDIDGGENRDCRGSSSGDLLSTYYVQMEASSIQACQDACVQHAETDVLGKPCKGIAFDAAASSCRLWLRAQGIEATVEKTGSVCQRLEPFLDLDGRDRGCAGLHELDISADYYVEHSPAEAPNLEACRKLCISTLGCTGVQYSTVSRKCAVWTHALQTTVPQPGAICLRLGRQSIGEIALTAGAFQPVDGGVGRACRGAALTDTQASYYIFHSPADVTTLDACKILCAQTSGCRGIQFSIYGCQVWTRPQGIETTATSPDLTCLRYEPFRLVDGLADHSCASDGAPATASYVTEVSSLQGCQLQCMQDPGCRAIEHTSPSCAVWTTAVAASAVSQGASCMRYEPFVGADGGVDRSCRGAHASDDWPSYYEVYSHTWAAGPSIEECKDRCLATPDCKGIEYTKTSCKVWTRLGGIQSTVVQSGSLCLRFGHFDPHELLDAFVPVDGGEGRACRGSDSNDLDASYFLAVGPDKAATLEACKSLCLSSSGCSAVQFGLECQLWTQPVAATAAELGTKCLRFRAFRDFDGSQDRLCEGGDPIAAPVSNLAQCEALCRENSARCTGINLRTDGTCHVFTSVFSSRPQSGSRCFSHQPFVAVDGGVDKDCRGSGEDDANSFHYVSAVAANLEDCKVQCVSDTRCQGIAFSSSGCKVWIRAQGIQASKSSPGSICLRYGVIDPMYDPAVSAFRPMDGGIHRACRGSDIYDNLDSHFFVSTAWPENSSMDACQNLCMNTPACKGIEFRSGACEVWTLPGGVKASVPSTGRMCVRYQPFQTLDGFSDRVCRGSSIYDSQASYYAIYSPSVAPTLDACKDLCRRTHGCKGIEYRGWCEVWTRPEGIDAVAPSLGAECWQYRPFVTVEGGINRACRGADPRDTWPSYYTVYGPETAPSIDACKALCVRTDGCKGIEYHSGHCQVWTRRGGIQGTSYSKGSLCMRMGPNDVWDDNSAFVALNGGSGTCQGAGLTSLKRGSLSLESCKMRCMATPSCRGVGYSSAVCTLWLGSGELSAIPNPDASCYSYRPFRDIDGGENRDCRGANSSDVQSAYYVQTQAPSVQMCRDACVQHAETDMLGMPCKGIAFDSATGACQLWVRPQGVEATVEKTSSVCQRLEPFLDLDGAENRACAGLHPQDVSTEHYVEHSPAQASNLDACRKLCISNPNCTGVQYSIMTYRCRVWTSPLQTTTHQPGAICLRLGKQSMRETLSSANAFRAIDGGAGRACRGATLTDTQASYYIFHSPADVATLGECKILCAQTSGCRGIQFSIYGCQVWTRPQGIETTATSPDLTCLQYEPFRLADGLSERSCAASGATLSSYATEVSSLQSCQLQCMQDPGCRGIEHTSPSCAVWTTAVAASSVSQGTSCMRYEPFVEADGGVDRSCRGAHASDDWPSYYEVYDHTWAAGPSIEECKDRCLATPDCKGIEYTKTSCKVWIRLGGIQSTVAQPGSLCLRFGQFDPHELLDAFVPVHGGEGRACRGSDSNDLDASYFSAVGPDKAASLQACKSLCLATFGCSAVQFSLSECQLWTRSVEATAVEVGSACFQLRPFRDFDGSQDRLCEAAEASDAAISVPSLAQCQELCSQSATRCTGINFQTDGTCHVFTSAFSSRPQSGSRCFSHQPFVAVDGGADMDCRGSSDKDLNETYFTQMEAASLEQCKLLCVSDVLCQGVAYVGQTCKLWTRAQGIQASKALPGSFCLRLPDLESLEADTAFKPVDGGVGRACRGQNETDNLDAHYTVHVFWPENSSLAECQNLCLQTTHCKGVEFRLGACEIWTLAGGIQASVAAPGRTCTSYEPFRSVDGFDDRVCRGENVTDSLDSYYDIYSPTVAPDEAACRGLCEATAGCQGIEYRGWCEVWTRPKGIMAVGYSPNAKCLRHQPFQGVDGGSNRACRGAHPGDTWDAYFQVYGTTGSSKARSLDECKALCVGIAECKGIEYREGRCEVWTRFGGIGASVASKGAVCLRKGARDVVAESAAFRVAGRDQACRGASAADNHPSYYFLWGPALVGSEELCLLRCLATPNCRGTDWGPEGCKVWTRDIEATVHYSGTTCRRYEPFEPVDGGEGRACNVPFHSKDVWLSASLVPSLRQCKLECASRNFCKGLSFNTTGCQLWSHPQGIQATTSRSGSTCLRHMPFTLVNGSKDRACRGLSSSDIDPSYYVAFPLSEVPSLELCRQRCAFASARCTGVEFSALGCKVWTRPQGIQATENVPGAICLRHGPLDLALNAAAFKPADGGVGRACRGDNETDNSASHYTLFWAAPENESMSACQERCVRTPGCKGIEYRFGGCEVWTPSNGIQATVFGGDRTCLHYQPFQTLDGFDDRVCRGANISDSESSYFLLKPPSETPTLEACQRACMGTPGCKGIEFRSGWCEVWTRPQGIQAVAPSANALCQRYEPFLAVDGGSDRACRGAHSADTWSSYYTVHNVPFNECKDLCLSTWRCRGIQFRETRCEVWTRALGIQSSAALAGSLCLRLGTLEITDSFIPFHGGENRSCRGAHVEDDDPSHYMVYGPDWVSSIEDCKLLCTSVSSCQGVDFSPGGCKLWTRALGIGASAPVPGSTCLAYEPFRAVDGGDDRECRGQHAADLAVDYYTFHDAAAAPTLRSCQMLCADTADCKAVSFEDNAGCRVWTTAVEASVSKVGSACWRYEPFTNVDSGVDRSCRGAHIYDNSAAYYLSYSEVTSLEGCRAKCAGTKGCQGLELTASHCHVWLRAAGIGATVPQPGSLCMHFGSPNPFREADAFPPVDGGLHRACRGELSDAETQNFIFHVSSKVRTLEACQMRCIFTAGCTGVEFNFWGCEVWTSEITHSVYAPGYRCARFQPFRSASGFGGQACRGQSITDNFGAYFSFYEAMPMGPYDGTMESCQKLCATTSGCKGIERTPSHCEVWTKAIGVTAPAWSLSSCLRYEPFTYVEGGIDRACRGEDPLDDWPSYYTWTTASSLQECKHLCMAHTGCLGIEYRTNNRCELWTRARGIGSTAAASGSVCMRYGSWDPSEVLDGFLPADGGLDRACRGQNRSDMNQSHYAYYALDIAPTLDACKAVCTITPGCKGVEFSHFGCEVWTRPGGIGATAQVPGFECYRYVAFEAVDGGVDRACRGADADDQAAQHFMALPEVNSLDACQQRCLVRPGCKGVAFSAAGCQLWTRAFGIGATAPEVGSFCYRHEPFTAADGGKDRACRGAKVWDNSTEHYRDVRLPAATLAKCKALCVGSPGCKGIEFQATGICSIWTRPGGIDATAEKGGSICLRFGATQAGAAEEGDRIGNVHLAKDPTLCLDITGLLNGSPIQISACESAVRFLMNSDTAQIRLLDHPEKCVDVAGGVNSNGTQIQLWDCGVAHPNMQFLLPDTGLGQIRWATHATMCLDSDFVPGAHVRLFSCRHASLLSRLVLPPGESRTVRTTKFVAHYLPWFLGKYNANAACERAGDDCAFQHSHWCGSGGNSYYTSWLGAYDLTNDTTIDRQLDLMASYGLDGLWIDYQLRSWDPVVDRLVAGLKARNLGFAIMVDASTDPNALQNTSEKVANWTKEPHYFRHQGLPIIPIWNNDETIFTPLPVNAIYISRYAWSPPEWATDTYTWVSDSYLESYYELDHPIVSSGSIFRGFRDCYLNKTLQEPTVTQLDVTMMRSRRHRPEFIQLVTWNDYTEGTQLEPSFLRREDECVDVCGENCLLVADCHSYETGHKDCSKPLGQLFGPTDPACNISGNFSAYGDLEKVSEFMWRERYIGTVLKAAARI